MAFENKLSTEIDYIPINGASNLGFQTTISCCKLVLIISCFPSKLKLHGSLENPTDYGYRPISLLPMFSKILERGL